MIHLVFIIEQHLYKNKRMPCAYYEGVPKSIGNCLVASAYFAFWPPGDERATLSEFSALSVVSLRGCEEGVCMSLF